jgi:hypothetical protein
MFTQRLDGKQQVASAAAATPVMFWVASGQLRCDEIQWNGSVAWQR